MMFPSQVRVQCFSGTHAIACALFGILRPGDTMLACSGRPYDTLDEVIGTRKPMNVRVLSDAKKGGTGWATLFCLPRALDWCLVPLRFFLLAENEGVKVPVSFARNVLMGLSFKLDRRIVTPTLW